MLSRFIQPSRALIGQRAGSFSTWDHMSAAPPDQIHGLNDAYKKDCNPKKVLLGVGAYRDDDGKPYTLPCVTKAKQRILEHDMDHEYAPIQGIDSFIGKALRLAYGENSRALAENRIAGC